MSGTPNQCGQEAPMGHLAVEYGRELSLGGCEMELMSEDRRARVAWCGEVATVIRKWEVFELLLWL